MTPSAIQKVKAIERALSAKPMTLHELAAVIPMSIRWTRPYIQQLHEAQAVYIAAWTNTGGPRPYPRPVYAFGMGKDKKRPDTQSRAYKNALRRKYWKSNPESRDREISKKRLKRKVEAIQKRGKPAMWFASLPGAST